MYMKTLRMLKETWPLNSEEKWTGEKCWNLVLQSSLKDLLPKCEIKVEEVTNAGFGSPLSTFNILFFKKTNMKCAACEPYLKMI